MEQVLTTGGLPFTSTTRLSFYSAAGASFRYDDIQVIGSSLANTATTFACNDANELTGMTRGGVTTSFEYDAWGRMSEKTRGGYGATYAWGQGHKLTGVTSTFPGEANVTYAYGGDGKRRERNDGTVTGYNWDGGWNVVNEENGAGALTSTLLPGLADIPGPNPATGAPRYFLTDHLGSLRALHATDKSQLGVNEYTPYGEDYLQAGAVATRQFTGHEWDGDAGLYFAPYRYYTPGGARWSMRNPLGAVAGPNLYGYVGGNPITYWDPLGLIDASNLPWPTGTGPEWNQYIHNTHPNPAFWGGFWDSLRDNSHAVCNPCEYGSGDRSSLGQAWEYRHRYPWSSAGAYVGVGVATIASVGALAAGVAETAVGGRLLCMLKPHPADHRFPLFGGKKLAHLQANYWFDGVSGSGDTLFRIPIPQWLQRALWRIWPK